MSENNEATQADLSDPSANDSLSKRYENAWLKIQLAAEQERHSKEILELKFRFKAEIEEAEQKRIHTLNQLATVQEQELEQQRKLHQTILHLQQKLQGLEDELEVTRNRADKSYQEKVAVEEEAHSVTVRHEMLLAATRREKVQVEELLQKVKEDLNREKGCARNVTAALNKERHQNELIKNKVAEVEQQCKVQLVSAQNEVTRLCSEREQLLSTSSKKISDLNECIQEERSLSLQQKEESVEREMQLERKLSQQKQDHLSQGNQLIAQNTRLQERNQTLESELRKLESQKGYRILELEKQLDQLSMELQCEKSQKALMEGQISELHGMGGLIHSEKEASSLLHQEMSRLEGEVERLCNEKKHLNNQLLQMKHKVTASEFALDEKCQKWLKEAAAQERVRSDLQESHEEELAQCRARIIALQGMLNDRSRQHLQENSQLKQKANLYGRLIKKLRHKLELVALQVDQLEAQREALRENIPVQLHQHMQRQLDAMKRKHHEFAAFIRGTCDLPSQLMQDMEELTSQAVNVGHQLSQMDESQLHCLSDLESL